LAAYLKAVWSAPLDFTVPNREEEIVWGRIQSFIGKYSTVKIQVATDYVVQTYNTKYGFNALVLGKALSSLQSLS